MQVRRLVAWFGVSAVVSSALGCGSDVDEQGGDQLLARLRADDYQSWTRASGWETAQPTIRQHGATAEIFLNPVMAAARDEEGLSEWPEGAILVKDSFKDGSLSLIAAMEKGANGWYYAEWDASGDVLFAGSPEVCVNCHQVGADHVLSVALP